MADDNMDEFHECSVCMVPFDEGQHVPRLLQCQHSFCDLCIANFSKKYTSDKYTILCPICREEHVQKINKEIPKNRLIINLIQHEKGSTGSSSIQHKSPPKPPVSQPQPVKSNKPAWDPFAYLKELFDEIDSDRDHCINAIELHEALRRGQPSSKFDLKTIAILMQKYDKNHDGTISYNEFQDLFIYLNEQYETFLFIDEDSSGTIDSKELINCLFQRVGQNLSEHFKKFVNENLRRNTQDSLTFDHYCRLLIRFENLRKSYDNSSKHVSFEQYLQSYLFDNFW